MDLLNKTLCLLLLGFLVVEIFPQEQYHISINGNINNSFPKESIYNISVITQLKKNNSAEVLDSLICIYLNGNRIRISYNYNDDLTLNYFTIADWFIDEWINSDKHTNTYDTDGNLESVLWEWFNASSQEWLKVAKDVYNYDSSGNQITHLYQIYNGQEFINEFRYEYYYNTTNKVVLLLEKFWNNGNWINASKTINTYSTANLKDTTLMQDWKNEQWVNYQMNIYGYDEKLNIISNLAKRWQENNWLNFGKGSFEYDFNNNCVLENWEIASNNNWKNWFRIFYKYDINNLVHLFGEEWENEQWVPENELLKVTNPDGITFGYFAREIFLYYSKPTSLENEKNIANGFNLLQNYPNPFNSATAIQYSIPQKSTVTLKIFDLLGYELATLVNEEKEQGVYTTNFDANNLASGLYLYRIQAGSFIETKKMILLK